MIAQTLVLDSEGLSKVVRDDRQVMAMLEQARLDDAAVVTSAVTLVEAVTPGHPKPVDSHVRRAAMVTEPPYGGHHMAGRARVTAPHG